MYSLFYIEEKKNQSHKLNKSKITQFQKSIHS
jgi:hypothetical protein